MYLIKAAYWFVVTDCLHDPFLSLASVKKKKKTTDILKTKRNSPTVEKKKSTLGSFYRYYDITYFKNGEKLMLKTKHNYNFN